MTNSLPWKITMLSIGKPSISMGHLCHGYVKYPEGISDCRIAISQNQGKLRHAKILIYPMIDTHMVSPEVSPKKNRSSKIKNESHPQIFRNYHHDGLPP